MERNSITGITKIKIIKNKSLIYLNIINYYNYLNNNSIKIINKFYHYDFLLFNYDKITEF